jgi:hypothetical protein
VNFKWWLLSLRAFGSCTDFAMWCCCLQVAVCLQVTGITSPRRGEIGRDSVRVGPFWFVENRINEKTRDNSPSLLPRGEKVAAGRMRGSVGYPRAMPPTKAALRCPSNSFAPGQRCEAFWCGLLAEVFVLCGTGFASVVSRDGVAHHWQSQCHVHKVCGKMLHSVPHRGERTRKTRCEL